MTNNPFQHSFKPDSSSSWRNRVEKELKEKEYKEFLHWKSINGFDIESWQSSVPQPRVRLQPLKSAWKIIEPIYSQNAQKANELALKSLMNGAEGIWYSKNYLGAAAEVVRSGIDEKVAPVFINDSTHIDIYRPLLKSSLKANFEEHNQPILLNGLRPRERGASIIDEVAILVSQGLESLRKDRKPDSILFYTGVGSEYLTEIAKIRSLRWLWSSILKNEGYEAENPQIFAVNLSNSYSVNDPYTNNLRATSAAMSSIIGGAQFVMIEPWDKTSLPENESSQRMSRNIQTLLKEEAKLDKTLYPSDGSFFIENLTLTISSKVWDQVQTIEKCGGFIEFALSGKLRAQIETNRNILLESYLNSKKTLLGVNKYRPEKVISEIGNSHSRYDLLPDYLHIAKEIQDSRL